MMFPCHEVNILRCELLQREHLTYDYPGDLYNKLVINHQGSMYISPTSEILVLVDFKPFVIKVKFTNKIHSLIEIHPQSYSDLVKIILICTG